MRKPNLIIALFLLVVLAACSSEKDDPKSDEKLHNPKSGDTWEQTVSKEKLPSFLDQSNEDMHTLYLAVAQHQRLLQQIPCYCGCA